MNLIKKYNIYDRKINEKFLDNIKNNFHEFELYNIASDIYINISDTELLLDDPIDDLNDIINDFKETIWRFENTSKDNALWFFMFSYKSHWGKHLSYYII